MKKNKKQVPKWIIWSLLILMMLIIIIFNDAFGDNELFAMVSLLYFFLLFFLLCRWIFRQIKSTLQLKKEKAQTELQHLKSQVNPHFFFNMLNNLYGLVGKDTQKAQELILKLSDMMRYSIYEGEKETVDLEKEVDFLKNYIDLHKMRYHKSIEVNFDIDIQENHKVMPLLFIILLENAFKHGVENLRDNAYINASIISTKKEVSFKIENNFDDTEINEQQGIGLKNLKRRLELFYTKTHSLSLSKKGDIYKAKLTLQQL